MLLMTALLSDGNRWSVAGPVRHLCLKDHIIPIGFSGWRMTSGLRRQAAAKATWTKPCCVLGQSILPSGQTPRAVPGCHLAARHWASLICSGAAHAVQEIPAG